MKLPASGMCNMRCGYCFYAYETRNREQASYGIMSEEAAETLRANPARRVFYLHPLNYTILTYRKYPKTSVTKSTTFYIRTLEKCIKIRYNQECEIYNY